MRNLAAFFAGGRQARWQIRTRPAPQQVTPAWTECCTNGRCNNCK